MRPNIRRSLAAGFLAGTACTERPVAPAPAVGLPAAAAYVPGQSYFGHYGFIEYIAGNLPVIFAVPHGGTLQPEGIPVRAAGAACGPEAMTVRDANTEELGRELPGAFAARTGGYPHIVINRLHRNRLDANRSIVEAACGAPEAAEAWRDFHRFIDVAKSAVVATHGRGFYTDLHGHGHAVQRLELGYDVPAFRLRTSDSQLDGSAAVAVASSVRTFMQPSALSLSGLLRGPRALGTLLAEAGYPAVPSALDPAPLAGQEYFSGGYNTERHACANGGAICGVQLEANMKGVRDSAVNRARFAATLAAVYPAYLAHFGITLPSAP